MSFITYLLLTLISCVGAQKYTPDWTSLDSRPNPAWYDEGKVGIFVNWGVYSVPSFGSEWFWEFWQGGRRIQQKYVDFMKKNYPPGFTYPDFASQLKAELYDPYEWAKLFAASGARYVVVSTKHHEGYTMFPSKNSFNWNSMDVGPKRDLIGDIATAVKNRTSLHFGIYHSLFEWFNPVFLSDTANNFTTQDFVKTKTMPELYDIVRNYKPEVVWSDGDMTAPYTYWNSTQFIAWLYNESPVKDTVVTNDRWGTGVMCHHGGFYTCMDRYNPGKLQNKKWENAMTIDRYSWGYRREANIDDFLSIKQLLATLIETISCGGNILVNVSPASDGTIRPIYQERLMQMGAWLKVNGDAIYGTSPWSIQRDTNTSDIWYTSKKADSTTTVFPCFTDWPTNGLLILRSVTTAKSSATTIRMLGYENNLTWKPYDKGGVAVLLGDIPFTSIPSYWAWCLAISGL